MTVRDPSVAGSSVGSMSADHRTDKPTSTWRELVERHLDAQVTVGGVTVSPDGARVAFTTAVVDLGANTYRRRIWLAATDGTTRPMPITSGEPGEGDPAWSPDGRHLVFVSARTATGSPKPGSASLHVLAVDGPGEVRCVVERPDGIASPRFSPDGRWIAFAARVPDERYSADSDAGRSARRIDHFYTRLNGEGWIHDRPFHLFVIPADGSGPARDLTPHDPGSAGFPDHDHRDFCWTPDSTGLVMAAHRHPGWDLDLASDLYLVALDGGIERLTAGDASLGLPSVSPDGTLVAFVGSDDPLTYPQNAKVGVLDRASGERRWVSAGLDRTVEVTSGAVRPVWVADRTVAFSAEDRGTCHLFTVEVDSGGAPPQRVTSGARWMKSWDVAGGTTVAAVATVDRPAELIRIDAGGERALTAISDAFVRRVAPVGWHHFTVACPDPTPGTDPEIDAWIMCPPGVDPTDATTTHPVILNVHGGPHTQYGETYFDEAQVQAAAGFIVIMSNPRGGSGREEAWGQAILGPLHPKRPGTGWGGADLADVLAVLDAALARFPACDPRRVGMQGGSYGGYMATLLAARHGGRLRAVCSERAVNNLLTEEWSSDIATMFRVEHGPDPVEDPEEYTRMSPIRLARDIDVPVLIIHSEDDIRCPMIQAEELFITLRLLDKPVEFWRFPGEDHELSRSGSPTHRRQRFEIILDWFGHHLAPLD
ncbi:MAG: hypothetical protein RIR49_1212 [Actinomycetota bacterium]